MTEPAWGTPDREVHLGRGRPTGAAAMALPAPEDVRRQATVALGVNLAVLLLAFGLVSLPGAVMAWRARTLVGTDLVAAQRALRWSWLLLLANLLFYLLLLALGILVAVTVLIGRR